MLWWSGERALRSRRYQRKPGDEDAPQASSSGGGGGGRVRRAAAAARRCGAAQLAAAREAASWGLLLQARRPRVCGGAARGRTRGAEAEHVSSAAGGLRVFCYILSKCPRLQPLMETGCLWGRMTCFVCILSLYRCIE